MRRSYKIVHFADLHLDAQFAWMGVGSVAARRRRQGLRETLRNIAKVAKDVQADALFCGGDLYEPERVESDTGAFLADTFRAIEPIKVYLAPGNHDWYGPESLYASTAWSANVHVFKESRFQPVELARGLTLWGAAHMASRGTEGFLNGFRVDRDGIHLALFHGAERGWFSEQEEGKALHAPFDAREISEAGFHHAFLGHYHRSRDAERFTYPGNPEPLAFGEDGERGVVIATVDGDGRIHSERRRVNVSTVHEIQLDVTGCRSQQDIRDRLSARMAGVDGVERGTARITLVGELDPDVALHESDVRDAVAGFDAVRVDSDLRPGYDIEAIRQEPTVRGQFVEDVLQAHLPPTEQRRILLVGLRAFDGRKDLDVL